MLTASNVMKGEVWEVVLDTDPRHSAEVLWRAPLRVYVEKGASLTQTVASTLLWIHVLAFPVGAVIPILARPVSERDKPTAVLLHATPKGGGDFKLVCQGVTERRSA